MRFGIQIGPTSSPGVSQGQIVDHIARQAIAAKESGFEGLMYSHHFLAGPESRYRATWSRDLAGASVCSSSSPREGTGRA